MANANIRSEFIKIMEDTKFLIDSLEIDKNKWPDGEDWSIHHAGYNSYQQLRMTLYDYSKRIILDTNLPSGELKYFSDLLNDFRGHFKNLSVNGKEYLLQSLIEVKIEGYESSNNIATYEHIELERLNEKKLKLLMHYSKTKLDACNKLIESIMRKIQNEAIPDSSINTSVKTQVQMNITAADFSVLVRLLVDNKIIQTNNKEELYRFIASNFLFNGKKETTTSNYVKKRFLNPPIYAIENIKEVLIHLRQSLKDID